MSQRFLDRIREAWDSFWKRGSSVPFVDTLELDRERPLVRPAFDLLEGDAEWLVQIDMPGVAPSGAKLQLDPYGTLKVHGHPTEAKIAFLCEVHLGPGIDLERARATLANGVLTVRVPRTRESLPKHIEVRLVR